MRSPSKLRQFAAAIGRDQIVVTADQLIVDENLRHRAAAAAALKHRVALRRIGIHAHLLPCKALGLQKVLGGHAVRAYRGGIDFDLGHCKTPK
jgi:hypothetical protein